MSSPILHHVLVGDENAPRRLFLLHGIYGAGRNWASFARDLVAERPDWNAVLIDLRMHGRSQGFEPPHTLASCVRDLMILARERSMAPQAILGHSFGGKVALMAASALHPEQIWVIDSTPSKRTPGGSAMRMLQILRGLPTDFEDRSEAVAALESRGLATHVAHWMATNLELDEGRYRWRFDVADMESLLDDFFRRDLWDVVESPPTGTDIHMVRATESDVFERHELERVRGIASPHVHAHEIRGGHWLHQDNPSALLRLLADRLPE